MIELIKALLLVGLFGVLGVYAFGKMSKGASQFSRYLP